MDILLVGIIGPLLGLALLLLLAYLVIRRAVRDGVLDAREMERQQAAERRGREEWERSTRAEGAPRG